MSKSGMEGPKASLHPILINNLADDSPEIQGAFRPRANTDPTSPKPRLHVHFDLPDIVVDDCSDNEEEGTDEFNRELANTAEGAFFVFTSPPRQRSNTCPMNMFSRRKLNRPATPPPNDGFGRHSSKERVTFSPHKLSKVAEDAGTDSGAYASGSKSPLEGKHSNPKSTHSYNRKSTNSPQMNATNFDTRKSRPIAKNIARQNASSDSPNSSPKRSPTKGKQRTTTNGHHVTSGPRDIIHSTA